MNNLNENESILSECSVCGQKLSSTAEVCPHCGQRTLVGNKKEEEKNKTIISLMAAVLDVIGAILVVTSMPINRSTEGTFFFGMILFACGIGIDIGMFIINKKNKIR